MQKEELELEQTRLARQVVEEDEVCWELPGQGRLGSEGLPSCPLRYIGGVDVSFAKGSSEEEEKEEDKKERGAGWGAARSESNACACLVVLAFPSLEVVYEATAKIKVEGEYVAGFLAFREVDPLRKLVEELRERRPGRFLLHRGAGYVPWMPLFPVCHHAVPPSCARVFS